MSDFTILARQDGSLIRANNERAWEWLLDHERGGNYSCCNTGWGPSTATATTERAAEAMDLAERCGFIVEWLP